MSGVMTGGNTPPNGDGDMNKEVYDPTLVEGDAFNMGNMAEGVSNKIFTSAERTKLDGIEAGAKDDQTGAEIKALYEAEPDTNAFTDADVQLLEDLGTSAFVDTGISEGDVVVLDASAKLPVSVLPALALTDVNVVASEAAQLALVDQEEGDVCVRTDEELTYIHNGGTAGTMADWTELQSPTNPTMDTIPQGSSFIKITAAEYADLMFQATYDPTGIQDDAFDTANFPTEALGSPTLGTDLKKVVDLVWSPGSFSGNYITDGGSQTINVAAGEGAIRKTDSPTGVIVPIAWSASNGNAISDGTVKYVGVEYNAGSPQIILKDVESWNRNDEFPLGLVVREGTVLHIYNNPFCARNVNGDLMRRLYETEPFEYASRLGGGAIGNVGTNQITVTAFSLYDRHNRINITDKNTSTGDTWDEYYADGVGGFTKNSGVSQWNNTQYDDGSGTLQTLTPQRWGARWWYIDAEDDLVMVYGTSNAISESLALSENPPTSLPLRLQTHGRLIGHAVFKVNDTDFSTIESLLVSAADAGVAVNDHGQLSGLGDDDHPIYMKHDDFSADDGLMIKTASETYSIIKVNLAGAVAPTVNEDSGDGYSVGSRWIDTVASKEYVCTDPTVGAAVWVDLTGGGGGGVGTSGSPVDNDWARFTDSETIEGLSDAEVKTALGYMTDLSDDGSPTLGGDLNCGNNRVGFPATVSTPSTATLNVSFTNNKLRVELTGNITTVIFPTPTLSGNYLMMMVQDATGNRTVTGWDTDIKWAGGAAPTLSTGSNAIDILSFYFDSDSDKWFGAANLNFA